MLVAGIQMSCGPDKGANLAKAAAMIQEAARKGARLVCLQELFATVYFASTVDRDFFDWAEPVGGETTRAMGAEARRSRAWLLAPLFERDPAVPGRFFNSAILLTPQGEVAGIYRKMFIPFRAHSPERYYFMPGNIRFPVFQVDELRLGVNICYDRHFPELARVMALKGAHLLVYPTASKAAVGRANTWIPEMISRAAENIMYVMGVSRCGQEGADRYFGNSILVDPYGQEVAGLKDEEGILLGEVDPLEVDRARQDFPHLRDLRADVYQELLRLMYAPEGGPTQIPS